MLLYTGMNESVTVCLQPNDGVPENRKAFCILDIFHWDSASKSFDKSVFKELQVKLVKEEND